jgi:hypothetical protein
VKKIELSFEISRRGQFEESSPFETLMRVQFERLRKSTSRFETWMA